MVNSGQILLVEDDPTVADVVGRYLQREGFSVELISDGKEALKRALASPPDLVVLDIMLPGMDGLEVCHRLRARAPVPVIMLTALGGESDRIAGLEIGADDYVSKPFSVRELTARVKSVLRRARRPLIASELQDRLTAGDMEIDIRSREVWVKGRPATLTTREFDLLTFLMLRPRRVFSREELLEHVWDFSFGDTSTVTVHIRRLREKIEEDPAQPKHIVTAWGLGYRFEP